MISSNISDVIARLQKLKTEIPTAVHVAFNAAFHKDQMLDRVRNIGTTINGWNEDDEKAFSQILSTLEVSRIDGGIQITMSTELPEMQSQGKQSFPTRDVIREWIDTEKDKDAIDYDENGNVDYKNIMGRIYGSMQRDPDKWFNSTNPTRLIKMSGAPNASKERLETALESVRTQLNAYCNQEMPIDVERQLWKIVT